MGFVGDDYLQRIMRGGDLTSIGGLAGYGQFAQTNPYDRADYSEVVPSLTEAMNALAPLGTRSPQDVQAGVDMVNRILPEGLTAEPGGSTVPNGSLKDPMERADQSTQTATAAQVPPWVSGTARVLNPLNLVAVPFRGLRAVLDTVRGAMGRPTLEDQATGAAQFLKWTQAQHMPGSDMLPPNVQTLVDRQKLGPTDKAHGVVPNPQDTIPDVSSSVMGFLTGDTLENERQAVEAAKQFMARIKYAGEALTQRGQQMAQDIEAAREKRAVDLFPWQLQEAQGKARQETFDAEHQAERYGATLDFTRAQTARMREGPREPVQTPAMTFDSYYNAKLKAAQAADEAKRGPILAARAAARSRGLAIRLKPPLGDFGATFGHGRSRADKMRDALITAQEMPGVDFEDQYPFPSIEDSPENQALYLQRKGYKAPELPTPESVIPQYESTFGFGTRTLPPKMAPDTRDNSPTAGAVGAGNKNLSAVPPTDNGIDYSSPAAFWASTKRQKMSVEDADALYRKRAPDLGWPSID